MIQRDQFGNTSICNQTIYSSAGSIDCTYDETIGDSYITLSISKDGEIQGYESYVVVKDDDLDFLGNNFFIVIIFMLSLVGMAFSSPEWMIINGIITLVIASAFYLINGVNIVAGLGNVGWLIISAGILLFKLAKQEDR